MRARLLADEGEGPAVLYVPGIDGSGELLLGTRPRLAARFRLLRLCYDGGGPDDYGALAASVAEVIERAGLPPVLVLSESFGVAVSLRLALDHPALVRGLLLVNGFAHFDRRFRLLVARATAPFAVEPLFRAVRRRVGYWSLIWPRKDSEAWTAFKAFGGVRFDAGYRRRLRMISGLDLRERLPAIRVPVSLFAADRDRIVPSVRAARIMGDLLPDASLEVLSDAGHVVLPLADEPWRERLQALDARARGARGRGLAK